jgi:hypothetical protein
MRFGILVLTLFPFILGGRLGGVLAAGRRACAVRGLELPGLEVTCDAARPQAALGGILRRRRACQQHHPDSQTDERQIQHPYRHRSAILPATQLLPQANQQVTGVCPVLEPYTSDDVTQRESRRDESRQQGFRHLETALASGVAPNLPACVVPELVGAEDRGTICDLGILADQATEPVSA